MQTSDEVATWAVPQVVTLYFVTWYFIEKYVHGKPFSLRRVATSILLWFLAYTISLALLFAECIFIYS